VVGFLTSPLLLLVLLLMAELPYGRQATALAHHLPLLLIQATLLVLLLVLLLWMQLLPPLRGSSLPMVRTHL
jgi:hypothetical protein